MSGLPLRRRPSKDQGGRGEMHWRQFHGSGPLLQARGGRITLDPEQGLGFRV